MALPLHCRGDLERAPTDRPVLALMRHAERPAIPRGSLGNAVPITARGRMDANLLGTMLQRQTLEVFSSPVPRAVQTARALCGHPPVLDRRLGDPGVCVRDPELAWPSFRDHDLAWVVGAQLDESTTLPGFAPAREAAASVVHGLMPAQGLRIAVTHDAILAVIAGALFDRRDLPLPDFLDTLYIWRSGGGLRARYLGYEVLLDEATLKPSRGVAVRGTRIRAPNLELTVAAHCNLRCAACSHRAPVAAPRYIDAERLARDLGRLREAYRVERLKLMGGEPLLHPEFVCIARVARESGIAREVVLCTNGRRLRAQPDNVWLAIDRIALSVYPGALTEGDVQAIIERAAALEIPIDVFRYDRFRQSHALTPTDDHGLTDRIWRTCHVAHHWRCHNVFEGRFALCPQALHLPPGPGTDADAVRLDGPHLRERLLDHLDRDTALASCAGCLGSAGALVEHQQLPRQRWNAFQEATVEGLVDWAHLARMESTRAAVPQGCLADEVEPPH